MASAWRVGRLGRDLGVGHSFAANVDLLIGRTPGSKTYAAGRLDTPVCSGGVDLQEPFAVVSDEVQSAAIVAYGGRAR